MITRRIPFLVLAMALVVFACNKTDQAVTVSEPVAKNADIPVQKLALPTPVVAKGVATPQVAIMNAKSPEAGVLTGGQPTKAQLREAKAKGFKIIINTRAEGEPGVAEAKALVEGMGMKYVWIPMKGAAGLTKENAQALADALSDENKPALVHCGSGNRVGGLFAMKAFHIDGKSADESLAIGLKAGLTRLEGAVKEKLTK